MLLKLIKSAKISLKITILYTIMFSLLLLLLNASILYGVKYYLYLQGSNSVRDTSISILNKLKDKNEPINPEEKSLISSVSPRENLFVKVVNKNGIVINISDKFNYNIKITTPYNKILKLEQEEKHMIYENVSFSSKDYGVIYIQVLKDLATEYKFIKILFYLMALADFVGMLVSIFLGYILSKKMLKPIDNITKTAQNISIKNLKERIEVKGPDDELKRLASTFNEMIDRLQGAFEKQTHFVSDASHELRTPIAVIKGYANLLYRWGKDDKEALEKSVYAIKLEAENMATLVEKLLFLANADSDINKIDKEKFWLNQLIDDVVKESRLIDTNLNIYSTKNESILIFADYQLIKQLLRIFIDNSIKFSSNVLDIDVSSIVNKQYVHITITDKGDGIPEKDLGNIFDRFYCADKSRSKEKSGSGLGLSIAKWIVEMHYGNIIVESEEGIGTKITVSLKLTE